MRNEMEQFNRDEDGNLTIKVNGESITLPKNTSEALASYLSGNALKVGDVVYRLVVIAKKYREKTVKRINLNKHMNDMEGKFNISQDEIDAILTDFINHVAEQDCMDLALYTKDLRSKEEIKW